MIDYLSRHPERIWGPFVQHIQILLIVLVLSVALASVLTILSMQWKGLGQALNHIFSVIYSIPSLALFAILIPVTGLGMKTAVIVLAVYNQYLLLRNFLTGLNEVDPAVTEAARGMGMTKMQTLFRVRVPLAKRALFSGVRLAKVISIMGEMGRAFDGGYAEYALLPNEQIYPVDTDLDWTTLSALPETYYTAFGSFLNLRIREGDRVLVRGGTSGVGVAFLRLVKGKYPGVSVTGTTRSVKKVGLLKQAGYDAVILEADGKLRTEEQFTKVLELIGPATLMDTFAHTAEGGIVCSTGQLGHQWTIEGMDPIMDLPANGYLTSFYSGNVDGKRLQAMLDYVEKYRVDAAPAKVFSLVQVPEAHAWLESGESIGKAVVLVSE